MTCFQFHILLSQFWPHSFLFCTKHPELFLEKMHESERRNDARTFITRTASLGNSSCLSSLPVNKRNGFQISLLVTPARRCAAKTECSVLRLLQFLVFFCFVFFLRGGGVKQLDRLVEAMQRNRLHVSERLVPHQRSGARTANGNPIVVERKSWNYSETEVRRIPFEEFSFQGSAGRVRVQTTKKPPNFTAYVASKGE